MTPSERNNIVCGIERIICEKLENSEPLDAYFIRTFLSLDLARGVLCGLGGNINNVDTISAVSIWEDTTYKLIGETCGTKQDVLDMISQMIDALLHFAQEAEKHG